MKKLPKGYTRHKKLEPMSPWKILVVDEILCPHGVGHSEGIHGCHAGDDGKPCCEKLKGLYRG